MTIPLHAANADGADGTIWSAVLEVRVFGCRLTELEPAETIWALREEREFQTEEARIRRIANRPL